MIVRYFFNHCVGTSTHIIDTHDTYTDEFGLGDRIARNESARMRDVVKGLDLTPAQRKVLTECMRERSDHVIILEDGNVKDY